MLKTFSDHNENMAGLVSSLITLSDHEFALALILPNRVDVLQQYFKNFFDLVGQVLAIGDDDCLGGLRFFGLLDGFAAVDLLDGHVPGVG